MGSRREKFERLYSVRGRAFFVEHPDKICGFMSDFKFERVEIAMIKFVAQSMPNTLSSVIDEGFDGDLQSVVTIMADNTGLDRDRLFPLIADMCAGDIDSSVQGKKDDADVKDHEVGSEQGRVELPNGDVYEGDLINGKMTGKGRLTYANGDIYEGDLVDGMRSGKGKMTFSGFVYEGSFIDNKMTGKGRLTYPNGTVYEGDFIDCMLTGKGRITWPNGKYCEGDFVNDRFEGNGTCGWPNGDSYTGQFVGNYVLAGKGTYRWADGTVYEGEFKYGLMDGTGTITFKDGSSYSGKWSGGKKDGYGIEFDPKAILKKRKKVYSYSESVHRVPMKLV